MKIIYAILLFIHAVLFKRIVRAKAWTEKNIDHDTVHSSPRFAKNPRGSRRKI